MVGIRDLKNRLSQYLQYVKDGEKVIVTEHNKIIAEIKIPGEIETAEVIEIFKQHGKEDEIIPAKRQSTCMTLPIVREKLNWMSDYNETRADRL